MKAARYLLSLVSAPFRFVGACRSDDFDQYIDELHKEFLTVKAKAEKGDDTAQYDLGLMYYQGRGVQAVGMEPESMETNYAEAVKWWRKAADQGFAPAQYHLGFMYQYGQGVKRDYAEAVKCKRHRWCLLTEDHQRGRRCRSRRTTTSMMPWLVQWFGGLWPRLRG